MKSNLSKIEDLLIQAKKLAVEYKKITGKPLGITGEMAEFSAARLLNLELMNARQSGYDAIRRNKGKETKIQIKGRCIPANAKPGQRLGSIQLDKDWDTVVLVLMNEHFDVLSIYEADRPAIESALRAPGSKARNIRGALGVNKFKSIGRLIWKCGSK